MVITRRKEKGEKFYKYYLDGKRISRNALAQICRKYLTDEGMDAMWIQTIDHDKCVLELGGAYDENKLLDEKNAELKIKRAKIAELEEKLVQTKLDAANYVLKHI